MNLHTNKTTKGKAPERELFLVKKIKNLIATCILFSVLEYNIICGGRFYKKKRTDSGHQTAGISNWCHSIQITIHYILIVKLFHFLGLPRRNNLPAIVSNISPAYQIVKCHRCKRNNLFIIHCSRINYMEWHQLLFHLSGGLVFC